MNEEERERRIKIVTDEYDGILHYTKAFYLRSVLYSTDRAVSAFNRYEQARKHDGTDAEQVSCIHEALGHAASLSRFFWPSGLGKASFASLRKKRGKKLRDSYGIAENSILRDRRLRDALEHFDERLDNFCIEASAGVVLPDAMIGDASLADDPLGTVFKLVDPDKEIFVLLSEKFPFKALRAEIESLHGRLQSDSEL